jgi:SAM-dependent methyltransferase
MIIRARPSKTFFYSLFERDMKCSEGLTLGADIACARFKNYPFFKTKEYLGVDLDPRMGEHMPAAGNGPKPSFLEQDLRSLDLTKGSVDFLVSTHTLCHLKADEQLPVLSSLIDLVKPGGFLIIQVVPAGRAHQRGIDKLLALHFSNIEKSPYRNVLSRVYERFFASGTRVEQFGRSVGRRKKLQEACIRGLCRIERSKVLGRSSDMVYYFCSQKCA